MLTIRKDFYDIDLNFLPTLTKDIGKLVGTNAINAEIYNVIFVKPGEKLFVPTFGLGIILYLFENDKVATLQEIKSKVETYLNNNSKKIKQSVIETATVDENTVLISIYYLRADIGTLESFQLYMQVIKG